MPKINQEEYNILKELDDKWKWIARSGEEGLLWVYTSKPTRRKKVWIASEIKELYKDLFQFIKWEDSEPYNIAELIEEYEKESEETEVKKDIEWLKRSIGDIIDYYYEYPLINGHTQGMINEIKTVMEQADEQEVLSQEWVEDNFFEVENWDDEVFISDGETAIDGTPQIKVIALQDLKKVVNTTKELPTVPKQEEQEKPVVPDFVFNHIKKYKDKGFSLWSAMRYGAEYELETWMNGTNQKLYARAWLAYPNIEVEEQKYYVKEPTTGQFLIKDNQQSNGVKWVDGFSSNPESYTEQEIKNIDERYWEFRKPVEEEEE